MASRMIQNNFGGGEISPTLFGRSDLKAYYSGCASAENFIVTKEGTLRKRNGITSFLTLTDYSAAKIVPYKYDRTGGGYVLITASGTKLTCAYYRKADSTARSTCTVTSFAGDVKDIQSKQIGDQLWIANGSFYAVLTISSNKTINASTWSQTTRPKAPTGVSASGYKSDGTAYNPTSGRTIGYAAYIVADGVMSSRVSVYKTWPTTWTAGYYIDVLVSYDTSENFDYILLTKKIGGSYGEVARWYPEDVDRAGQCTFRDENISAGDAVYAQTNVLGDGFTNPLCVDCFQQRKVFANATTEGSKYPMTMWFSEVGNLDNFYADRPAADSDAFSPTISSTGPSYIRWVCCFQEMMILLTDCGLFSVGFSQTQGFSASTCRVSRFSQLAVSPDIQPIVTDAGIVFVGGDNKTLYTASYDLQENSLKPINRSVLVEHLTRTSTIKAIALQEYPDNRIWVVTADGKACTFTFERDQEVYAWSHSVIDGVSIIDVIAPGTVTDGVEVRSYSDLIFVVEKAGVQYLARLNKGYSDSIGDTTTNVKATLDTLRPESQERTIAGYKKNVKDVLLRLYETGGISVRNAAGTEQPLVPARTGTDGLFTGDVKVMPRGLVNEEGQLTFVSDNDQPCEILQVVTNIEVAQ